MYCHDELTRDAARGRVREPTTWAQNRTDLFFLMALCALCTKPNGWNHPPERFLIGSYRQLVTTGPLRNSNPYDFDSDILLCGPYRRMTTGMPQCLWGASYIDGDMHSDKATLRVRNGRRGAHRSNRMAGSSPPTSN